MRKCALVALIFIAGLARAQEYHPLNFNIGGGVGLPMGRTSDFANVNGNFVVGAGLNVNSTVGFNGEFMWHGLPPSDAVIAATGAPDAKVSLYGYTGSVIFRLGTHRRVGAYAIGGGGWYHRGWSLTAPGLVAGTVCAPAFTWYGVGCVNGLVPGNVTLNSGSANAGGLNVGGGLTLGTGAKLYLEVRYHHAYFSNLPTDVLPVTFGVRW